MYNYHNNHKNNHSNKGASYVWRLTFVLRDSNRKCVRVFTNKQEALKLMAHLDGKSFIRYVDLEKYKG